MTHLRLQAVQVGRGSGFLTDVTAVSAGDGRHTCALREDGTVWCWGEANNGQVGDGTTGDPVTHLRLVAVQVVRPGGPLTEVRTLDGGVGHTCAMRSDHSVWCWGRNGNGELGRGTIDGDPHPHPTRVLFP